MTGFETIILLSTIVVISNTVVLAINTKTVSKCMEVIDGAQKY